ncbi:hypothetical protein LI90_1480 [Carbonactinospora thermoautotrophica]|uniref:Uncharacterized protein n=1 Tax=Carbonactinospora thermoautotrophica TaxID=1469144 RepID=A0A132MR23_9ACTN|nr:hypothetical protein LI90_1480 [Carbonactinospora thermoautotrophica]
MRELPRRRRRRPTAYEPDTYAPVALNRRPDNAFRLNRNIAPE